MQQKNGKNWNYESALSCMLLFVQRVDELLFHHTLDTYRYPSLSLRGLAIEFCSVYFDSQKGLIDKKNLPHIIDVERRILSGVGDTVFEDIAA